MDIGIELGISYDILDNIQLKGKDNGECLTKMLVEWLKGTGDTTPKWSGLISALTKQSVGRGELAKDLTEKIMDM